MVVTHFNKLYLPQGIVLIESILKHAPNIAIMIYSHDDETSLHLKNQFKDQVRIRSLVEVINQDKSLQEAWYTTPGNDRYFVVTPHIMLDAIKTSDCDTVIYLDADLMMLRPLNERLYIQLRSCDVGLTTHYFPRRNKQLERFGRYNVGLVVARNTAGGLIFLNWWADRCTESVSTTSPDSMVFGDQKYLNLVGNLGMDVAELDANLVNVGPWSDTKSMDLDQLQSFHFSGARLSKTFFVLGFSFHANGRPSKRMKEIYAEYRNALKRAHLSLGREVPLFPQTLTIRTLIKAFLLGDWMQGA